MTLPGRHVIERPRQRSRTAAALSVTHHEDFADLQLRHREFERSRNAVEAVARLVRRSQRCDVPGHEHLAGAGVEDLGGVAAAVCTGKDHHLRALTLR